ncbi:hypothetical protein GCM10020000_29220 [Streptomyces olivoverticillatus]
MNRWNYVLDKMVEQKWLDPAKRKQMKFEKPGDPKPSEGLKGQNGYLVEAARQEIIRDLIKEGRSPKDAEQDFAAGGWTITLSIDPKRQQALEGAVKNQLLDHLDPKAREVDGHVQPGAVSVDRKTGKIVALYGGQDYLKHYTNNATRRDYQPASTFKPLILVSALDHKSQTQDGKSISPATIYDGTNKRPVVGPGGDGYAPENEDQYSNAAVTVQEAMNRSVNTVFAQMAVDVGLDKVKKTAVDLGMRGDGTGFDANPSMALGSMGASPLDMSGVYATLDNHGQKTTPSIVKSASRGGKDYQLPDAVSKDRIVSRDTADGVTSVLQGVVDDGTANVVQNAQYQVAGKTGTSDDDKSAWFTGYTPDLITSVGLFGEAPRRQAGHADGHRRQRPCQRWYVPGEDLGRVHLERPRRRRHRQVRPGDQRARRAGAAEQAVRRGHPVRVRLALAVAVALPAVDAVGQRLAHAAVPRAHGGPDAAHAAGDAPVTPPVTPPGPTDGTDPRPNGGRATATTG